MTATPVRSLWRVPAEHARPPTADSRNVVVRPSGPGSVHAYDRWVDEEAVRRGCMHHSAHAHFPFARLTFGERREVVTRMTERRREMDDADIAAWIGSSTPVIRAYRHWIDTGEWVEPQRISATQGRRRKRPRAAS